MDDYNNGDDGNDGDDGSGDNDIWSSWQFRSLLGVLVYTLGSGKLCSTAAISLHLTHPGAPNKI